jgi:FkbM family methyltransferase
LKKISKKNKPPKAPKRKARKSASKGEVIAAAVAHFDQGSVSIKPSQPIPVYEVRERREITERGIGQLLSQARMQWQFAEWERLCQLDLLHIEHHPDRAELALLAGCGALQLGEQEKAAVYLKAAREWDCDERLMFQLLLSGIHNSLGRYHVVKGNEEKADKMLQLGGVGLGGDGALITEIRRGKEHTRLGVPKGNRNQRIQELPAPTVEKKPSEEENIEEAFSMERAIEEASRAESPFKEGITSYAQNFEDVMLWRALGHIKNGFYIDIGAQHPVIDSVSKAFYEKGWRGIHVEATPAYAKLLRKDRPDEIVIEAAVSDQHGSMSFFEIPETGMSTGDEHIAAMHREKGFPVREINVPTLTLADILTITGEREIHWLKIDVEGMEKHVLKGWCHHPNRPWILVVEATLPLTTTDSHHEWEHYVIGLDYFHAYNDGLSRFYVSRRQSELLRKFNVPPNVFDNFSRKL